MWLKRHTDTTRVTLLRMNAKEQQQIGVCKLFEGLSRYRNIVSKKAVFGSWELFFREWVHSICRDDAFLKTENSSELPMRQLKAPLNTYTYPMSVSVPAKTLKVHKILCYKIHRNWPNCWFVHYHVELTQVLSLVWTQNDFPLHAWSLTKRNS